LDATKNMIWADNNLRGDFTACVQLFQDFINQRSANGHGKSLNISEVDTKKKDKDKKRLRQTGAKKGNSGVEFRYYKAKEYQTLNQDQREELRQWRKNRDNKDDKADQPPPPKKIKPNNNIAEVVTAAVAAVQAMNISATSTGQPAAADASEQGNSDRQVTFQEGTNGNRNHTALTRQPGART